MSGNHELSTLADKRVVVTGASQGLGLAIAHALLARGARVTAIARSEERLEAARQAGATIVVGDATDAGLMSVWSASSSRTR